MQDDFYIGQIIQFSGNYEFEGRLFCDGRTLDIASYTPLYSIIGTKFGGDGTRTFKIPKMESVNGFHYLIVTEGVFPERANY